MLALGGSASVDGFSITERGSTIGRDIRGGIVTYFTLAYTAVLNPLILGFAQDVDGKYLGFRFAAQGPRDRRGHSAGRGRDDDTDGALLLASFSVPWLTVFTTVVGLGMAPALITTSASRSGSSHRVR